jgi:hypothetical protein
MKKYVVSFISYLLLIGLFIPSCTQDNPIAESPVKSGEGELMTAQLTEELDIWENDLIKLVKTEKLAHDVYSKFSELFPDNPVFEHTAASERVHWTRISDLIATYDNLGDPTRDGDGVAYAPGVFDDAEDDYTTDYNTLTDFGGNDVTSAFQVGYLVECLEILTITKALASAAEAGISEVQVFYNCLRNAEPHHLKAYNWNLLRVNVENYWNSLNSDFEEFFGDGDLTVLEPIVTEILQGQTAPGNGNGGTCPGCGLGPFTNHCPCGFGPCGTDGTVAATLSEAELNDLVFLVKLEKMAHEVYTTLSQTYSTMPILGNISAAEYRHWKVLQNLFVKYGETDPTKDGDTDLGFSCYNDEAMSNDYQEAIDYGAASLVQAMETGAILEQLELDSLTNAVGRTTLPDLTTIYTHFINADGAHLNAFEKHTE